MKKIPLTKGLFAIVDDENFDELNQYKWHASRSHSNRFINASYYACRDNHGKKEYMHRVVSKAQKGDICDHINGNTLDNTKANLRLVTRSQNAVNRNGWGSSKFLGVSWRDKEKKWHASIQIKGKKYHLGLFNREEDAAVAYNEKAIKVHGEYVRLNPV